MPQSNETPSERLFAGLEGDFKGMAMTSDSTEIVKREVTK